MTADVEPAVLRRGELHHLSAEFAATGSPASVRLIERPFLAQLDLRVTSPAAVGRAEEVLGLSLPRGAGGVSGSGPRYVLWCGPGWWLVVDSPGTERTLEAAVRSALADHHASVVDVSAQRTVLELSGPRARDVLSHGCHLDLHIRAFPVGSCAQTMLAKAQVLLHHVATAEDAAYRIHVSASFADYLARWLLDAMVEYVRSPA